ncbi:hypothetical protein ES702_00125 [subsurface metagenome]
MALSALDEFVLEAVSCPWLVYFLGYFERDCGGNLQVVGQTLCKVKHTSRAILFA